MKRFITASILTAIAFASNTLPACAEIFRLDMNEEIPYGVVTYASIDTVKKDAYVEIQWHDGNKISFEFNCLPNRDRSINNGSSTRFTLAERKYLADFEEGFCRGMSK